MIRVVFLLLLLPRSLYAETPLFDVPALSSTPLKPELLSSREKDNIITEEVRFHSHLDGKKSVDIFAIFSYPKGAKKLPAFIWNQGGLYQATPHFPELGAKRGYAVLCIDFPISGYRSTGGYPINSNLSLPADPMNAPIRHGAIALLKAVTYLQSRPEVNAEKIGMAGSSWGGFFTTLMISLDARLKVGSSLFGCGSLQLGNSWWDGNGPNPEYDAAFRKRWEATLDPTPRLRDCKTPMAWFSGTNDSFYWMPALMDTYNSIQGPKHLGILPNFNHALTPVLDEQVFAWLDIHLQGKAPFSRVSDLKIKAGKDNNDISWKADTLPEGSRAEILFSPGEAGNWSSRVWLTQAAAAGKDSCSGALPHCRVPLYVIGSVTAANGFRSCTAMAKIEPLGREMPAFDGCAEWGDFEKPQIDFLKLHGYPLPRTSSHPFQGEFAIAPLPGKTILPPVLFVAGEPQEMKFRARAGADTEVEVSLVGKFDGKPYVVKQMVPLGMNWREFTIRFTPPKALSGSLHPEILAPSSTDTRFDLFRVVPAGEK